MPYGEMTDEEKLADEIKTKKLSNVYLIYGNDSYLKSYYCEKLAELSYSGDPFFNLQKFGYNCDLQDVYDAVNQFPVMADSKCVILDDFDVFGCGKDDFDKLCKIASEIEDGCVFIIKFDFVDFDRKKDSRVMRLTKAVEKSNGKVYNIAHRGRAKLIRLLINGAKKRGVTLTEKDAAFIVDTVGDDLSILSNELEKLCAYKKEGTLTREDIENVCVFDINGSVYDYVAFITKGDASSALKLLDKMFFMRVEPMSILFNISSVYFDIYRALAAKKAGKTKNDIVTDFGYPKNTAFKIDRANTYLLRFDAQKINKSFDCLLKTDKLLKSFNAEPRSVLEQTTVELTAILSGVLS